MRYLLLPLIFIQVAMATTYYVATDGNDGAAGGITTPWLTVNHSVSHLAAGDTLYLRGGTYHEAVTIGTTIYGVVGNRITIKAYPGETPIMDGRKAITGWTQCASDEAGLTVCGVTNPNATSIYKASITATDLPTKIMVFEGDEWERVARQPDQTYGFGLNEEEMTSLAAEAYLVKDRVIDSTSLDPNYVLAGYVLTTWPAGGYGIYHEGEYSHIPTYTGGGGIGFFPRSW